MIKVDMIVENVASVIISHFFSFSMLKSMCSDPANSKNDKTPCSTKSVKLSLSSIDSMISFMITAGVNLSKISRVPVIASVMSTIIMLFSFCIKRSFRYPNKTVSDITMVAIN